MSMEDLAHVRNPSTQEAEAGESSKQGEPGLENETLSPQKSNKHIKNKTNRRQLNQPIWKWSNMLWHYHVKFYVTIDIIHLNHFSDLLRCMFAIGSKKKSGFKVFKWFILAGGSVTGFELFLPALCLQLKDSSLSFLIALECKHQKALSSVSPLGLSILSQQVKSN